jgi:hypothetical protein
VVVQLPGPFQDWFQEYADAPGLWHIAQGEELYLTERRWGTIPERVDSAKAQNILMRRGLRHALKNSCPRHVTDAHLRQAQCRWADACDREHTLARQALGGTWQERLAWRDALHEHKQACQHLHNVMHTRTLQATNMLHTSPEEKEAHAALSRQRLRQAANRPQREAAWQRYRAADEYQRLLVAEVAAGRATHDAQRQHQQAQQQLQQAAALYPAWFLVNQPGGGAGG